MAIVAEEFRVSATNVSPALVVKGERVQAPNSTGSEPPVTPAPAGACDCHHHIFDPRFPDANGKPHAIVATVDDYLLFRRRLGLSRSIVIAASTDRDDNRCVLDALDRLGGTSRGVAIARPGISDAALDELHAHGVRGLRFYLGKGDIPTPEELKVFGQRAHKRNWHLQIVASREGHQVSEWERQLAALPCRIVIDHIGYAMQPIAADDPDVQAMLRLLQNRRTYMKLSGVYITSKLGFPAYADVDALAKQLIAAAPDRMLWGTDWPHPSVRGHEPDGAQLFDQITRWAPDEALRRQILVNNPQELYWAD